MNNVAIEAPRRPLGKAAPLGVDGGRHLPEPACRREFCPRGPSDESPSGQLTVLRRSTGAGDHADWRASPLNAWRLCDRNPMDGTAHQMLHHLSTRNPNHAKTLRGDRS